MAGKKRNLDLGEGEAPGLVGGHLNTVPEDAPPFDPEIVDPHEEDDFGDLDDELDPELLEDDDE